MNEPNPLSAAIKTAIKLGTATPNPVTHEELKILAARAQTLNEEALELISNLPPVPNEQAYVAMQLIRASFDHGRGLLFLLRANPWDMAGPALALHRSQIENFLRGAYLGFLATPEQVEDFLEHDEGVRELADNGKWQIIGPIRLAKRVEKLIDQLADEERAEDASSLAKMVENAWSPLCGMVHGGKAVRAFYQDGQGEIGCDVSIDVLMQAIGNCVVITNFGFLLTLSHLHNERGIPVDSPMHIALMSFMQILQEYRARQKM